MQLYIKCGTCGGDGLCDPCMVCDGTGEGESFPCYCDYGKCTECGGENSADCNWCNGTGLCDSCEGTGVGGYNSCYSCQGSGVGFCEDCSYGVY